MFSTVYNKFLKCQILTDVTDSSLFTNLNPGIRQENLFFMPISSERNASYGTYRRQREIRKKKNFLK